MNSIILTDYASDVYLYEHFFFSGVRWVVGGGQRLRRR